jgi:hypothetical protein
MKITATLTQAIHTIPRHYPNFFLFSFFGSIAIDVDDDLPHPPKCRPCYNYLFSAGPMEPLDKLELIIKGTIEQKKRDSI